VVEPIKVNVKPKATSSTFTSQPSWKEVIEDARAVPAQSVSASKFPSAAMLPNAIGCSYTRLELRAPEDAQYSQEAIDAGACLLRCLELRRKYIGPQAGGEAVEPQTVRYGEQQEVKIRVAAALVHIDGDAELSHADGDRRILWDPFAGTPPEAETSLKVSIEDGVFVARDASGQPAGGDPGVPVDDFCRDYVEVLRAMNNRSCVSFVSPRLNELGLKFELHTQLNAAREGKRQKEISGRDWNQIRKVDTHIHHSAAFTQKQLMEFIRRKMREEMDTPVAKDGDKVLTLREAFSHVGVSDYDDVNADRLCCNASIGQGGVHDTFGRFDRFNTKYNPFGDARMREVFLKTDNYIEGRFLAELTKDVMRSYQKSHYIQAEWRISIYGRKSDEWAKLALWFRKYNIQCKQVRWLIQVPRLYSIFRKIGAVRNFGMLIDNVFGPLFEASMDPAGHPDIFFMLQQIVGFDSVDDESQSSQSTLKEYPKAHEWDNEANPPYSYWMYHMYANIRSLNALRRHRGLNTFTFRPHCGEAGNASHLCSGFLLADGICHGIKLKEAPVLQYLYYLAQVGIAVSPLSNDILFLPLAESPFGDFFRRGLSVSLSTDDPLIIHMTEEALLEEYLVAARTFRLSVCDLCEVARNSVIHSGFEKLFKDWWIGCPSGAPDVAAARSGVTDQSESWGSMKTAEAKSNVPAIRLQFRADCLRCELDELVAAANCVRTSSS